MSDYEIRCDQCDRYLNIKVIKTLIAQVRCPNSKCKHLNNVKVIFSDATDDEMRYTFEENPVE